MPVQIQISDEVWFQLKNMKQRPSHTFDEIIKELIRNQIKKGKK